MHRVNVHLEGTLLGHGNQLLEIHRVGLEQEVRKTHLFRALGLRVEVGDRHEEPTRLEHLGSLLEVCHLTHAVVNLVILLASKLHRPVLVLVVNDGVRPELLDEVHLRRAVRHLVIRRRACHRRTDRLRHLNGEETRRGRTAENEQLAALLDVAEGLAREGLGAAAGEERLVRRKPDERQASERLSTSRAARGTDADRYACVLRERATAAGGRRGLAARLAEADVRDHSVADLEGVNALAEGIHSARDIEARGVREGARADPVKSSGEKLPVDRVARSNLDLHAHLALRGLGNWDILQLEGLDGSRRVTALPVCIEAPSLGTPHAFRLEWQLGACRPVGKLSASSRREQVQLTFIERAGVGDRLIPTVLPALAQSRTRVAATFMVDIFWSGVSRRFREALRVSVSGHIPSPTF